MRSSTVLVATALLAVGLSGCLGSTPAGPASPADDSPDVVTDPTNYTYVDNASFSTGGHIHDYWNGKDRLTVVDETRQVDLILFGGADPIAIFRPEEGTTIPQGTEKVEVTVDWTEEPDTYYDKMELWVKTAADNDASRIAEIEPGDTLAFETKNAWNDLPHRQLSAWEFQYYIHPMTVGAAGRNVTQTWRFHGEVSMHVEAVRGLELPVFPAHPDLWKNRSEIPLMDAEQNVRYHGHPARGTYLTFGGRQPIHSPDNGTIVPFDTDVVEFRLDYDARTPGTDMDLMVHAADTWEYTELEPDDVQDGVKVYRVPVSETMGDGPYSDQSLWQFAPYPTGEPQDDFWADGTYTLTAKAIRDA